MEHIARAIRCLEKIPHTGGPVVEEAVTHLRSVTRLLGSVGVSPDQLMGVSADLRARLLPLYRHSLLPSLEYMVSIYLFIHHPQNLAMPNAGNGRLCAWETLVVSIFSGLLDFLEESMNSEIREIVANVLYPITCTVYFIGDSRNRLPFQSDHLSLVYQTLTATVDSHPGNAAKLRGQIDRKRFGFTILETKNYLALESLLDLFGSLIPSMKGGRAKRTSFIKEVFDLVVFKNAGKDIQEVLEDISSPDWSLTSEKIVKTLAQHDTSFPQPFETSNLKYNESRLGTCTSIYVDKSQFIANIDKAGALETLCILFDTVSGISSSTKSGHAHIVLQLTKVPNLGNRPISTTSKGSVTISWDVNKAYFNDFLKALKSRQLNIGKITRDKLSTVKPVQLDFHTNKDSYTIVEERVQRLSQSWALNVTPKSSGRDSGQPETSPLLPYLSRATIKEPLLDVKPVTPLTVYLESNGNSSLAPKPKLVMEDKTESGLEISSPICEDSKHTNTTRSKRASSETLPKPRKQTIVVSDEETTVKVGPAIQKFRDSETSSEGSPLKLTRLTRTRVAAPPGQAEKLEIKGETKSDPVQRRRANRTSNTDTSIRKEENGRNEKRPLADTESGGVIHVFDEERPSKRVRHDLLSPAARASKVVKYSRKGPSSLPVASILSPIDFDTIPKSDIKKAKTSEMKGKNRKYKPKPKRISENKKNVVRRDLDIKGLDMREISLVTGGRHSSVLPKPTDIIDVHKVRRSARFAKSKCPEDAIMVSEYPPKPCKAPWVDPTSSENAKVLSDPIMPALRAEDQPADTSSGVDLFAEDQPLVKDDIEIIEKIADTPKRSIQTKELTHSVELKTSKVALPEPTHAPELKNPLVLPPQNVVIDLTDDKYPSGAKKEKILSKQSGTLPTKMPTEASKIKESAHSNAADQSVASLDVDDRPVIQSSPKIHKYNGVTIPPTGDTSVLRQRSDVVRQRLLIDKVSSAPIVFEEDKRLPVDFVLPRIETFHQISNKIKVSPRKNKSTQLEPTDRVRRPQTHSGSDQYMQQYRLSRSEWQGSSSNIKQDPMQKILVVIQQINKAIVHNIEHRFERVTEGLNDGQRRILEDTANGLQDMYQESVQYFNDLVDLEENYSMRCSVLDAGTHDYIKSSEQVTQCFKDITLDHSCHNLSKSFPPTLFPKIPAIVLNHSATR